MKVVWQRVKEASVTVNNEVVASIGQGCLVLVGVEKGDTEKDIQFVADKCVNLRVFSDDNNRLNLSLVDIKGEILVVSQFTLCGDCRKGRRPSFTDAAPPDMGRQYYERLCHVIESKGVSVKRGVFQADMQVSLVNDGPVTLIIESQRK